MKKEKKHMEETEELRRLRYFGSIYLQKIGFLLKVPQATVSTSIIYFHKFYRCFSFQEYEKNVVASACLFISCKKFEKPRRLRDLINVMTKVKFPGRKELNIVSPEFFNYKGMISKHEQIVLRALSYDLEVELPYSYLLNYSYYLMGYNTKNDKKTVDTVNKTALPILNDCYRTRIYLDHKASDVCVTAMFIATRMKKVTLHPIDWHEKVLGVGKKKINQIATDIQSMYVKVKEMSSSPN